MLELGHGRLDYRRSGQVDTDLTAHGDALASLVSTWSEAVVSTGWGWPGDWWHPSVEAAAAAVLSDTDPCPALARLGDARAQAGVGVAEALDDVAALYAAAHAGEPPYGALRAFLEAYGDAVLGARDTGACEDPLTGLATLPYLRTRIVEEYREAARDGESIAQRSALVVVDTSDDDRRGLLPAVDRIEVAHALSSVFSGGETCAVLNRHRSVALVRRCASLPRSVQLLQELLDTRSPLVPPARSWVEGLPPHECGAAALLTELAR